MAKKTTSSKTQAMRTSRESKTSAARRTVAEATPPNALDVADLGGEEESAPESAPEPVKPAARPVGRLVGLPKPSHNPSDYADPNEDDDDAEEDEEPASSDEPAAKGGKAVNAQFWAEAEKLGPAHAKATTTKKARTRVQRLLKALSRWELSAQPQMLKAVDALESAEAHLAVACNALEAVPRDWRPAKTRKVQGEAAKLVPGTVVAVREKVRAQYAELEEDPSVLDSLTVKMHAKTKVVVLTKDGTRYVIPRGHIVVVGPAPDADDDDAS